MYKGGDLVLASLSAGLCITHILEKKFLSFHFLWDYFHDLCSNKCSCFQIFDLCGYFQIGNPLRKGFMLLSFTLLFNVVAG